MTLSTPVNPGMPMLSLKATPEKFILEGREAGTRIMTHDPNSGLVIALKLLESYQSINSVQGLINLVDISTTNHNVKKIATQLLTPADLKLQTNFKKLE